MSDGCGNDNNSTYDLAVIGAGSAGFSAAITAAEAGAQVVLISYGTIGGTCVNVGCVPSKTLIRVAEALHIASVANRFNGIEVAARVTDWCAAVQQNQDLVDEFPKAKYSDLLSLYNSVAYLEGEAMFSDNGELMVDGDIINAKKIIIATGARPALPSIDGIENVPYLTSATALELETLPDSLLVIGAGYVGIEIAQIFSRAGVQVTVVSRRGLLPEAEPEISAALTLYFEDEGIGIVSGITYDRIDSKENAIVLTVRDQDRIMEISSEKVMIATGRAPNTDSLNLTGASIELLGNYGVKVDTQMRTSREGVYAAGDVTGRDYFVYMDAYGAKIAAKNAISGNSLCNDISAIPAVVFCDPQAVSVYLATYGAKSEAKNPIDGALCYDNSIMSTVVFCDPQVASVGLTEANARAQGINVRTSVLTLDNLPRARATRDTRGLIKLIANSKTKKLIGAHILAPEGADSIQTAALAIKTGMTYEELGAMIFPYLTTVEGLKLAAQTFDMDVNKLSCCAG